MPYLLDSGPSVVVLKRQVDVKLPGKGNPNSHGTKPVHLIIKMMKWIRTSRLSINNSFSLKRHHHRMGGRGKRTSRPLQGHLAHKTPPPPLGPPWEPRHGPTVGSYGVGVSYERGTPVGRAGDGGELPMEGMRLCLQGGVLLDVQGAALALVVRQ